VLAFNLFLFTIAGLLLFGALMFWFLVRPLAVRVNKACDRIDEAHEAILRRERLDEEEEARMRTKAQMEVEEFVQDVHGGNGGQP
jgi:hypothetical protein